MITARQAYRALVDVEAAKNLIDLKHGFLTASLGTLKALERAAEYRDLAKTHAEAAERLYELVRTDFEEGKESRP